MSCRTNNMASEKNGPKQPTSLVSTHSEVVKTNKSETFDPICFDPSVNIARRSPRSGPGRTTVTRPEQRICRKSSDCHSEVHIGAHKFDRLMQSVLTRSDRFVPMLHSNYRSPQKFTVPNTRNRLKRSQIIFHCAFPRRTSTLRNAR